MLFRPEAPARMWDTTVYYEEGVFHIFYLAEGDVGHVSTADFLTFTPHPAICCRGQKGEWNEIGLPLTGCLTKWEGGYRMLLGTIDPVSLQQVYALFLSDDLIEWTAYPDNPVLAADGVLYDNHPNSRDGNMFCAWRDPMVYEIRDGYAYLCLCARTPLPGPDSTGAVVACVRTQDFVHFEHLPPLTQMGDHLKYAECPDCFVMGDNRYLTFLDHSWGGARVHTSTREDAAGTFYMVQESGNGEFRWMPDSLLLGTSGDRQSSWAARSVLAEGDRLLYSHITATRPAFAFLKRIVQTEDGGLKLCYFPAMDRLLGNSILPRFEPPIGDCGIWTVASDAAVTGSSGAWGTACEVAQAGDLCFECVLRMERGARAGVVLRCVQDGEYVRGVAFLLDFERQRADMEMLYYRPGEGFGHNHYDTVNGGFVRDNDNRRLQLAYGRDYRLKIFARSEFFEAYLDGDWMITKAYENASPAGSVMLMTERGSAVFDLSLRELKGALS